MPPSNGQPPCSLHRVVCIENLSLHHEDHDSCTTICRASRGASCGEILLQAAATVSSVSVVVKGVSRIAWPTSHSNHNLHDVPPSRLLVCVSQSCLVLVKESEEGFGLLDKIEALKRPGWSRLWLRVEPALSVISLVCFRLPNPHRIYRHVDARSSVNDAGVEGLAQWSLLTIATHNDYTLVSLIPTGTIRRLQGNRRSLHGMLF
jgi:hypothetical protein